MKKVVLFMADGTEECEALITVDLLRRAGIEVTTASVMDKRALETSSGIKMHADEMVEDINFDDYDMLILPGGMPGTKYLGESDIVCDAVKKFNAEGKPLAAICAAPSVLGKLGVLQNRKAICYPGFEEALEGATISETDPVTDGNITTASGLGHAIPFALEIIKVLDSEETANRVASEIGFK